MVVQGGKNKKLDVQTFLSHLDAPLTFNSKRSSQNLTINGTTPNLLFANSQTNRIGIGGISAPEEVLHIAGNIKIGGSLSRTHLVSSIGAGSNDSAGSGYKLITITTSAPHGFAVGNTVTMTGINIVDLNGSFVILTTSTTTQFTYKVLNSVDTTSLITEPVTPVYAAVSRFQEGNISYSSEDKQISSDQVNVVHMITTSYTYTALIIPSSVNFTLPVTAPSFIEKTIYVKSMPAGNMATISVSNGLGFTDIRLQTAGASATVYFNGTHWVCKGLVSALLV